MIPFSASQAHFQSIPLSDSTLQVFTHFHPDRSPRPNSHIAKPSQCVLHKFAITMMEAEFDWETAWKEAEDSSTHAALLSGNSMRLVYYIRRLWDKYVATFVCRMMVLFADLVAASTRMC